MGKRKHRPVLHQQEQCDVWLSTAEKKEQTPSAKRQRVFRPITNIADIVLSSQPIKAGTKQTDIKNFFAPKAAIVKEETVPNASSSSPPQRFSQGSSTSRCRKLKPGKSPSRKCQNAGGFYRSHQNNNAETTSTISITSSQNTTSNLYAESVDNFPGCKTDNSTLLDTTKDSDLSASAQDLEANEQIKFAQDVLQISSANEESEDITFTMSSQGCWKSRDLKTDCDFLDPHECLNTDDAHCGVSIKPGDLSDSSCSQIILGVPNVSKTFAPAHYNANETEDSENISFTMGAEVCLKMKLSNVESDDSALSTMQDDIHESSSLSSQDSLQEVKFMGSQGCSKVRDPKGHRSNISQSQSPEDLSQDVEFTMGTQGCWKVRDPKGHRLNSTPPPPSEDLSQDVDFTMEVKCQKVRDHKGQRSNITQSLSSDDLSQDINFTMGTQGCQEVRDPQGQRSNITQSQSSEYLSQDINFTMGTQGCQEVRDPQGQRSSITQSQSSEDLSQDINFTMGTQGCLKVRGPKGHRSNIHVQPSTQFYSTDSDTPYCDDIDGESDDDEFSQTQDR